MNRRGKIEEEILEHLRLVRDLGVRWMKKEVANARNNMSARKTIAAALSSGEKQRPVVPPQPASLFDGAAQEPETLEVIREDLGECHRCKLAGTRRNIVFGSGNPKAELMFVGEAPGADEDEQGLPFVGRAGQLLTRIIEAIDLRRENVYICNIIKCRPPDNRNPQPEEIAACGPFLKRQIAAVSPKVICALGKFGAQELLKSKEAISRIRGHFYDYRGTKLIATFHPAYLLRNPAEKRKVWEDMQKVRDYLLSLKTGRQDR